MCRQGLCWICNGPGFSGWPAVHPGSPSGKVNGPHLSWGAGAEVIGRDTLTAQASREHNTPAPFPAQVS